MRLMSTVALFCPMSEVEKGCRTQFVSETVSASIMTTSMPYRWPQTRIARSRYGSPMTIALPVPPAPITRMRTARWLIRPGGSVCSTRILPPLTANELRQRLGQLDQGLNRKQFAFIEAHPKPLKSSCMASQAANIGMSESALIESALPFGDALHGGSIRMPHRTEANTPIVREIPEGSGREFRRCAWPLVIHQCPNLEIAAIDAPHQRGLWEDATAQFRSLPFRVSGEHLSAAARCPPHDHAVAFGENMLRQHVGCRASIKRMHQRFDKCNGERLGWFERRRSILVKHNLVPGHKAALAISVNQQCLTQLEALVLSD